MDTVDGIFSALKAGVAAQPEIASKMKGIIVYDVGGRKLTLDLKNSPPSAYDGPPTLNPDLTISVGESDFLDLAAGKLNPQQAFMKGKLKIKGAMALALKVQDVMNAARKTLATASSAPESPSTPKKTEEAPVSIQSKPIFDAIGVAISADGASLVKKVNGIIKFDIRSGSVSGKSLISYTIDLKNGSGNILTDYSGPVDLTLTISDEDLVALSANKMTSQQAFMKGKLKIKGSMPLAMKVGAVLDSARKTMSVKL